MTGDLSSFVIVSFLTSLLKTESVSLQALWTAAIATCFSVAYGIDILTLLFGVTLEVDAERKRVV